jgi:hypothetical protein
VLDFVGKDHARDMLRQTVRFCSDPRHTNPGVHPIRAVLPRLLEAHKLLSAKPGSRKVDDGWVERLAQTVHSGRQETAAEAVAAALADANGWRHIARVASARNTFASLIAAAYHTAGQAGRRMPKPYPLAEDVERVEPKDGERLIAALDEALRGKDQRRAAAVASRYGELGHDAQAIFAKLRQYSISEDGALHAEKYYHTVSEEYGRSRARFRWLHVVALARVTASAGGQTAPGVAEARQLLGL